MNSFSEPKDRKLKEFCCSQKESGKLKSKWVNAFKNVKGKQAPAEKPTTPVATGPPAVLDTSHQFQEYTYKNITPCDVCSQVMKGGCATYSHYSWRLPLILLQVTPGRASSASCAG